MSNILSNITEDELELCELFNYPIALAECLFNNADNLIEFDNNKLGSIRRYQSPMVSSEWFVDVENDDRLKDTHEKFNARKKVGDLYALGARRFGKSYAAIILDLLLYIIYATGEICMVSSVDMNHIDGVLGKVKTAFESHPFVKLFRKKSSAAKSKYSLLTNNNVLIESVNTNPTSSDGGKKNFYGYHAHRHYAEEFSLFTSEAMTAARDAKSERGIIERFSGMTNFNRDSPAGQVFYDNDYGEHLINYPQFVNPEFTDEEEKSRIKEFNGVESPEFKVFVLGEVLGDNVSVIDIDKVPFNRHKPVIHFEINEDNFINFRDLIIVNRPEFADMGFLSADVSDINITEIMLWYKWSNQFHYRYKITLHGLDDSKQKKIFRWLINKGGIDYTGIDYGDALGRVLVNYLQTIFDPKFIQGVGFNEKLNVELEVDKRGNPLRKAGKFVYKQEWVSIWSVRMMIRYMYNGQFDMAYDASLEKQLNKLIAIQNSARISYKVRDKYDHTFQALQVLSIMLFKLEFDKITDIRKKKDQPDDNWWLGA